MEEQKDKDHLLEFDDEFITVVSDYDEAVNRSLADASQSNTVTNAKRTRTYLNSEIPVRPCTDDCPHRARCKDFLRGRVKDKDLCKPELRQIKKWQIAFRKGDLDRLKDDVGTVAGSMAVQVSRLLEAVIEDGVIVENEKYDRFGNLVREKVAHPGLQQAANIMKTLGIDLGSFLMTPKAVKDAPPQVQVNVGVSAEEIHARFAARYGKKLPKQEHDSS
ncbi:hypothetical protein DNHGIG_25740 [Collibacillus ludicampi]|uniref:Terminase small subunit n=1 Tax=Collibacillus ludicampi TaxID=2771369 RepID=A0AAV4LGW1_9BACL|nr:hypothetical protein [Collibacillus ludicampi]GIM47025.1 hypothetical protein DNHGIG_25740 [Collibacillus ludicampi]